MLLRQRWWVGILLVSVMILGCASMCMGEDREEVKFVIGQTSYTIGGVANSMDVAPFIENGRTYVPVAYLANGLGMTTSWNPETQQVILSKQFALSDELQTKTAVVFTIGSSTKITTFSQMNNKGEWEILTQKELDMDVAPFIRDERTYLPARYVVEGLGYSVEWDGATQTVSIVPIVAGQGGM